MEARVGSLTADGCTVYLYAYGKLEAKYTLATYDAARTFAEMHASRVLYHAGWNAAGDSRWNETGEPA